MTKILAPAFAAIAVLAATAGRTWAADEPVAEPPPAPLCTQCHNLGLGSPGR